MLVLNGQSLSWTNVCVGVLQGYVLGPLLFFICTNDLSDNFSTYAKLFAEDLKMKS